MTKYPHNLNLRAVCAAIDAFEAQQNDSPESGMIAAFEILLTASGIVQRAEAAEARAKNLNDGWLTAIAQRDEARAEQGKLEAARGVKNIWKERAWAAEEKLAELDKPLHKSCDACVHVLGSLGFNYKTAKLKDVLDEVKKLRSAPAINLAELVPDEKPTDIPFAGHRIEATGWNACRAAILRNIEGAK